MKIITASFLRAYLQHLGYQQTYLQMGKRAFYNPRTRKELLIPAEGGELSTSDLEELFSSSTALDLPTDMELHRLKLYCCNMLLGMAFDPELFENTAA